MNSVIERIINNDRKAREAVEAAQRYRKEASAELAYKKAEIDAAVKEEIKESAKNAMEHSERESIRKTEEYRHIAEEITERMNKLYAERKSEWVDTYTGRIINRE